MPFDVVARRFAEKMHPLQYRRPIAAPTAGNIALGNAFARAAKQTWQDWRAAVQSRFDVGELPAVRAERDALAAIVRAVAERGPCPEGAIGGTDPEPCAYCGVATGEWYASMRVRKVDGALVLANHGDPRFDELGACAGGMDSHVLREKAHAVHADGCAWEAARSWTAADPGATVAR